MVVLRREYQKIFITERGPGPWKCFGCEELVYYDELLVHHKDEDRENNSIRNLAPMHSGCHAVLHNTGRKNTEATKAKMSESAKRRYADPEQRKRASEIQRKRTGDKEFSAKMSTATKKRYEDPEQRAITARATKLAANTPDERLRRSEQAKRQWAAGNIGRKRKV